jgi:dihydroneopterin aldolase
MDINTVFLKDMPFMLPVGGDAWHREGKLQPVNITLRVNHVTSINDAAASDDISKSLDYGKLFKTIQRNLDACKNYANVREIAEHVLPSITMPGIIALVQIQLPKGALRAEGGLRYDLEQYSDPESLVQYETLHIRGIKCACIIGVNPHERREKQMVIVHLTFPGESKDLPKPEITQSEASAAVIAVEKFHDIIEIVVKVRWLLNTAAYPTRKLVGCHENYRSASGRLTYSN